MRFHCVALLLAALFQIGAALAEPPQLVIEGEETPRFQTIDAAVLKGQRQDRITHITFHHEGFAGADADLFRKASAARRSQTVSQRAQNINHYHATGAGLGMIAYHYAVAPDGSIARGRPVRYRPATLSTALDGTGRADFDGHFAVLALGDFNHETLTAAARASYIRVMSEAQRAYRVPTANIRPHLDHAQTECPGAHIMAEADSLRRSVLVHSLQAELRARGCLAAAPDGTWGPASQQGLDALNRAHPGLAARRPDDAALAEILAAPALTCGKGG